MQALKAHSLKRACKNFHTTYGCQKKPFCPKHTWSIMRQRHLTRFVRNGSMQRSPHSWHRPSLKFGIFICDRNLNACQKNRARTDVLNKTKIWQAYYCSSLYICHTKAITTLVEYGTRCLYENTNFYSMSSIVRSASWLKLKVLIFGNVSKRAYAEWHGTIFNYSKTIFMTFKARSAKSTVTPLLPDICSG